MWCSPLFRGVMYKAIPVFPVDDMARSGPSFLCPSSRIAVPEGGLEVEELTATRKSADTRKTVFGVAVNEVEVPVAGVAMTACANGGEMPGAEWASPL